jgi:hypothetical protein
VTFALSGLRLRSTVVVVSQSKKKKGLPF